MDNQLLTEIFKSEYSNLVAVLCHYYGVSDIQFAEDIVSDTFIKAMKSWGHNGIPDSPKAWLRKAAQNKLKDHFRRKKVFNEKVEPQLIQQDSKINPEEITNEIIEDSQLKMIFVICNPDLKKDSQICLALRILCGFNISEIAKALLSNKETINKKLYRAKKSIKEKDQLNTQLLKKEFVDRLDNVLRIIYLLFNEGYYSSINEENIREDICWEAMRLTIFLSKQEEILNSKVHALLAMMCFHVSRLDARKSGEKGDLLYHEQDKSKWDQRLISKGKKYLKLSSKSEMFSKYHIEATIAFWHTLESEDKWVKISNLYDKLLTLESSPIIKMNQCYALAKAQSVEKAIDQAEKIELKDNHHYYCLLAELYRMNGKFDVELLYLEKALECSIKENERETIRGKIKVSKNYSSNKF